MSVQKILKYRKYLGSAWYEKFWSIGKKKRHPMGCGSKSARVATQINGIPMHLYWIKLWYIVHSPASTSTSIPCVIC
jgi:hypothetical protein